MTVGYDNLPVNMEQVLSLPMREATGLAAAPTQDIARPHHTAVLGASAPTWAQHAVSNLTYMVFSAGDVLSIAPAATVPPTDMNFRTGSVTGGFSFAVWVNGSNLGAINTLFCYGSPTIQVNGYQINILTTGEIQFLTYQAGPTIQTTDTAAACFSISTWWFIMVTCDGAWDTAAAKIYRNAIDVTDTAGVHISPATPAALDFFIGAHNNAGATELSFIGNKWNPRCWTRQLPQTQVWEIFEMERHLFDV